MASAVPIGPAAVSQAGSKKIHAIPTTVPKDSVKISRAPTRGAASDTAREPAQNFRAPIRHVVHREHDVVRVAVLDSAEAFIEHFELAPPAVHGMLDRPLGYPRHDLPIVG